MVYCPTTRAAGLDPQRGIGYQKCWCCQPFTPPWPNTPIQSNPLSSLPPCFAPPPPALPPPAPISPADLPADLIGKRQEKHYSRWKGTGLPAAAAAATGRALLATGVDCLTACHHWAVHKGLSEFIFFVLFQNYFSSLQKWVLRFGEQKQ